MTMTPGELLTILPHTATTVTARMMQRRVTGFSTDTRSLTTRQAFIALSGEQFDGHNFIDIAAGRRASVAIVSEAWFSRQRSEPPLPVIVVDDTLVAYGRIAT